MNALPPSITAEAMERTPARVYLDFYQLAQAPFAITPDPEFLFTAGSHQQAIDKITYAIDSRMGFILLTGEVGTGKTTLCRTLLDRLSDRAETVYVINPSVSGHELLTGILEDARITVEPDASKKRLIDRLYQHLLSIEKSRPFVVIVDDAQTMPAQTLEDLRLLSNLETDKNKLIQVVLSGQPELIDRLGSTALRQLRQRIAIHCRLAALSIAETDAYIAQRLFVAGNQGQVRFSPDATRLVHQSASGIPRLINKVCDYALTAGYVKDAPIISRNHVHLALGELNDLNLRPAKKTGWRVGIGAALAATLLAVSMGGILPFPENAFNRRPPLTEPPSADGRSLETVPPMASLETPKVPSPAIETTGGTAPPADATKAPVRPATEPAAFTEPVPALAECSPPSPYALQLGSFVTREDAERSVRRYRQKEILAHWQSVNSGQWYRVIAGKFESLTTARQYKQDHGLEKALIINAPLTVKLKPRQPTGSDADLPDFLSQIGHDCLMETGPTGDNEFYTGLFASIDDATQIVEKINASGRFVANVVKR